MSEDRFAAIEEKLNTLVSGQADLQLGQTGIESRLHKVEVTQEAMRDEIKQIAEGHGATQAAIERATKVICDHVDERIMPLEDIVRVHFGAR